MSLEIPRPARTDLTDRECTKIIGALLGGLIQMTTENELRAAVRFWAETDKAWEFLRQTREMFLGGGSNA